MLYNVFVSWTVTFTKKAAKQVGALPENIRLAMRALVADIEATGPVRGDWPNYSKLGGGAHHCHLKKGRPTYVACWREIGKKEVEVYYVGTHEKAPY